MVTRETPLARALRALGPHAADAAEVLEAYARILESDAVPRGFLGPREGDRLIDRHIVDSAALASLTLPGPLVDVGSGAGLPGIALTIVTGNPLTVVEAHGGRAGFLRRVAAELGVAVRVVRSRAEDAARDPELRDAFATGVARALAAPPVALELVLPFVAPGGRAVIAVGPSALGDDAVAEAARLLGGADPAIVDVAVPGSALPRYVMIVDKLGSTPDRYPRRAGIPARRPIGGRGPGPSESGER